MVQLPGEGGAEAGPALGGRDEQRQQVGHRGQARLRCDPAGDLRPLRGQQPDRVAVALGQPRPGISGAELRGELSAQLVRDPRRLEHAAEIRVEPEHLHGQPHHDIQVGQGRLPDPHPWRAGSGYRGPRARGPGGDHAERRQPVGHQRPHASDVAARPADHRGGVVPAGLRHRGQVTAPAGQQGIQRGRDVGAGEVRRQPEPAGGTLDEVERAGFADPVLAGSGGRL